MWHLQFFSRPSNDDVATSDVTEYGYDGSMTVEAISDHNIKSSLAAHAKAMDCVYGEVLVIVKDDKYTHVKSAYRFDYHYED